MTISSGNYLTIPSFYRDVVASTVIKNSPNGSIIKVISPLSRFDFLTGAGLAILFLIQKTGQVFLSLIKALFTLGQNKEINSQLLSHGKEVLCYLGAIPFGWIGAIFPQSINEKFLNIPSGGYVIPHPEELAGLLQKA